MKQTFGPADFATATGATPAHLDRLAAYLDLLRRWQRTINLVSSASLDDAWRRHVLDSAQLVPLIPPMARRLVDLGSGAGFPGLVIAILSDIAVTLVEADARKGAFLIEAGRITGTRVAVRTGRIESIAPEPFDVVTARALAPLPKLLEYAVKWLAPNGICLFPKGRAVAAELTAADETWKMKRASLPSRSDADAVILKIDEISRRL
ncbi:MAG: 16S rRNA (guanine(527)-N(7))-methyltransferase RsmG [Rhodospirillales bacterium]